MRRCRCHVSFVITSSRRADRCVPPTEYAESKRLKDEFRSSVMRSEYVSEMVVAHKHKSFMGRENADLESRKLYWAHPGESSVSSPLGFSRRLTELYSLSSRSPNLFISRVLSEEEKMHSIISSIHARVNLSVVVAVGTDRKGFVRQGHSQHNSPRSRLLWNKGKRSRPEIPKWFVVRESSLASSHFYSGTNRGSSLRV